MKLLFSSGQVNIIGGRIFYIIIFFIAVVLLYSACNTTRHYTDVPYAEGEECLQDLTNPSESTLTTAFSDAVEQEKLEDTYSTPSLRVAHAIGVISHLLSLDSLFSLEEQTEESRMQRLELKQKVTDRVQLVNLEISSLAAALQCEQNRAYQVADFLRQKERRRERNRNALSISITGTAALINAAFLLFPNTIWDDIISIGASAASVWLSLSTLNHQATATFLHPKNLLEEIWEGPEEPSLLPISIWYYLTNPYFSLHEERSIRQQLVRRWSRLQELEEENEEDVQDAQTKLILSEGGVYSAEQLRMRAVMLEHTAAEVNLMQRKVQELRRELIEAYE